MSEHSEPRGPSGQAGPGWATGPDNGSSGQSWQQSGQPQGGSQQGSYLQGGYQQGAHGQQAWQPHSPSGGGQQGWQQGGQPGQSGQPGQWRPGQGPSGGQPGQPGQWPQNPPTGPQGWQQPGNSSTGYPQGPGQAWGGQQGPVTAAGGQQGFGPGSQPAPGSGPVKSRLPLFTAIAVVIALVAGAGIYFFAIKDRNTSTASGQKSPQESVTALFNTLSNSDPIGLADQLDPAEASLFTDLNSDVLTELKRLDVLSSKASADSLTGTTISVSGLTFDGADETINDNLRIVKLTGGTITVASDPNNVPLSDKIKSAFGDTIDQAQPQSQTVNIADAVAKNDGKPIRVATVKRGDQWYVSLFYSIADNATHAAGLPNPTAADYIAPVGSASPEDAVNALIKQAQAGSVEGVIGVLPPDEAGALHDYGKLLAKQAGADSLGTDMTSLGVSIDNVSWDVSDVTHGKKVSIKSMSLTAQGQTVTLTRDPAAGSLKLQVPNQPEVVLDESTIDSYLSDSLGSSASSLDPQLLQIIRREFKQIIGVGIVTVQVDGQWYVSPTRSVSDIFLSLLKGLEPGDVDYLISLAKK